MDSNTQKFSVLVVGATGLLGSYITKHCLTKPNLIVSILVRDPTKCKELPSQVEQSGGKVIKGDVTQPETYSDSLKGIHTVISALSSPADAAVFVDPQVKLVNECIKQGVQRFVPSDFGVNYTKFPREEVNKFLLAKTKLEFDDYVKTLNIKTLHFWPGQFLELFFIIHGNGWSYWGDADQKYDWTGYEDMARFVAAAVAKKDQTGNLVFVANELTINELKDIYNKVRGTNVTPKRLGSLEELRQQYDEKKKAGDNSALVMLGMGLVLFDGRSKFDKNDNDKFPEVKPTPLEEFLKQKPDVKLQ